METDWLFVLKLVRDLLVALGIGIGALYCFSGYRRFDQLRQLPGATAGVLLAGGLAYLRWREPLVTVLAAAIGGWVGAAITKGYENTVSFSSGALVGAAVGLILWVLFQGKLPALLLFPLPIIGGLIAYKYDQLVIVLATALGGAGLIVGGVAYFSVRVTGDVDPQLLGAGLLAWLVLGSLGVIAQYRAPSTTREPAGGKGRFWWSGRPYAEFPPPQPSRGASAVTGHQGAARCIVRDPKEQWLAGRDAKGKPPWRRLCRCLQ